MLKLALMSLSMASGAPAETSSGPAALPGQFVAAWNSHDPGAFEKLYSSGAVWVPVAEERTEGRDAIVAEFAKIHVGGWAAKTAIAEKDVPEVHLLRPDVATILFQMDFLKDGKPVPGLQRALLLVAVREQGSWKIAAGQLTKESSPQ